MERTYRCSGEGKNKGVEGVGGVMGTIWDYYIMYTTTTTTSTRLCVAVLECQWWDGILQSAGWHRLSPYFQHSPNSGEAL